MAKRVVTWCILFGVALALGEVIYVTLGENFFVVAPGEIYRGSQPRDRFLQGLFRNPGIKTVLNLRGANPGKSWYDSEHAVALGAQITIIDLPLNSHFPPLKSELRRLIEIFDHAPRPIFLHCHSGADRTGLATMVYGLLQPGSVLDEERSRISVRFGHKFWTTHKNLFALPDMYAEWLNDNSYQHSSEHFRHWAETVYCARDAWARLNYVFPEEWNSLDR